MANWNTLRHLNVFRRDRAPSILRMLGYSTVVKRMIYMGRGWRKGRPVAKYKDPTSGKYKFYTLTRRGKVRRVR